MYRYRQDGAYGKVTLGRYPDLTLRAARDKRDELAAQVVTGRFLPALLLALHFDPLLSRPSPRSYSPHRDRGAGGLFLARKHQSAV
jgi:hypothetical protein